MSLKIKCSCCNKELKAPGALLFSPPPGYTFGHEYEVIKYHICGKCFLIIKRDFIDNRYLKIGNSPNE